MEINIESIKKIAKTAGNEILKIYNKEFKIDFKKDNSPLTTADLAANEIIIKKLKKYNLPIISEETKSIPFKIRKNWDSFWLIDPLDGTKEFIKKNGEFTVNIALAENNKPVLGVIYVPVKEALYFGAVGVGAHKTEGSVIAGLDVENISIEELIGLSKKLPIETEKSVFTVVGSRSHMSEETEAYINELREEKGEVEIISAGSALKLCLVAEGVADQYPRFAPTMECDSCAGHAIANCAGKSVIDYKTKSEMVYNRKNLVNNWFLVK